MALKIRLQLTCKRNARTFRVVAVDESAKRNGKVVELLGFINPLTKPVTKGINAERLAYWQKQGAQVTPAVKKYL